MHEDIVFPYDLDNGIICMLFVFGYGWFQDVDKIW